MKNNKHKTKEEFARELGMSKSTLYRRIHSIDFKTSGELLSPAEQVELRAALDNYKGSKNGMKNRSPFMERIDTD